MTLLETEAPAINKSSVGCEAGCGPVAQMEWLNKNCHCLSLDQHVMATILKQELQQSGLPATLADTHPHLFSPAPVFIARDYIEQMAAVIRDVESVTTTPLYQQQVLQWSPAISRFNPGSAGGLLSYDFHVSSEGPRLIEINTNPGGALLTTVLAKAQLPCCNMLDNLTIAGTGNVEGELLKLFLDEWRQGKNRPLKTIAIVDDRPEQQYLYPEFLMYQQLFRRQGIQAIIADPHDLFRKDGRLWHSELAIDFVYNRLTDFALEQIEHASIRDAYLAGEILLSPHPHAHARYADKRNLTLLSNDTFLRQAGVEDTTRLQLLEAIPRTVNLTDENRDALWQQRKQLFFKPASGYGSKAVYRGDKLTRRVWDEMANSQYVAQALVPPGQRQVMDTADSALKVDVRVFSYKGVVKLIAARLYQGQTTNFRTPYGGFAPVFTSPED